MTPDRGSLLLYLARAEVESALGRAVDPVAQPAWLLEPGACFVTLTSRGELRGCIGSLSAYRPLVEDLKANAYAAAFGDPRFPAVTGAELPGLRFEVSLLSPLTPLVFAGEREALAQLHPGLGVVLAAEGNRGTFLPQVWEQLPDPAQFLLHLKRKAGLPPGFWNANVKLSTYTVESWKEP